MLGGKPRGQPLVATSAAGRQKGRLLYVTDRESRLRFLVDTGAEVSILPPSKAERKNRQNTFGLLAANSSPIVTVLGKPYFLALPGLADTVIEGALASAKASSSGILIKLV